MSTDEKPAIDLPQAQPPQPPTQSPQPPTQPPQPPTQSQQPPTQPPQPQSSAAGSFQPVDLPVLATATPQAVPEVEDDLPWLPPVSLVAGHLAHAASWALLIALWLAGKRLDSFAGFAWPHVAGLAWLSVISLSVLFHVIPGFLDVRIPAERLTRFSVVVVWLGGLALAASFWFEKPLWLPWAGIVAIAGILGAVVPMSMAIISHRPETQVISRPAPLVPAFMVVMASLVVAALFGGYLAVALVGGVPATWLPGVLPAHAHIAVGGWLSLLVFGVSTRTLRRILGAPAGKLHGAASGIFTAGVFLLGFGWLVPGPWVIWAGSGMAAIGAILFAVETGGRVSQARGPHLGPRFFAGASALYLVGAAILGLGTMVGMPWGQAYAFLAIAGWIGQVLNGHLLHIGTRFMLTVVRGGDDETEPVEVLSQPVTLAAWALLQAAVLTGTAACLTLRSDVAAVAGGLGLAGWLVFSANYVGAWRRAKALVVGLRAFPGPSNSHP